ncbi:hypothetical protein CAPTEDRAFT_116236, partial [Capitella teleta]
VQGDPGQGKSTLCQALASKWSKEKHGSQCADRCIHRFDLVIYLTAADLKGYEDIPSAVRSHLLAKDLKVSLSALDESLRSGDVLFLIDAYDEGCQENPLLGDLIQGNIFRGATLLLTSRPNYATDMVRCFDQIISIQGFDANQQSDYVRKFATH